MRELEDVKRTGRTDDMGSIRNTASKEDLRKEELDRYNYSKERMAILSLEEALLTTMAPRRIGNLTAMPP